MPKRKANPTLCPHLTARSQSGQDKERRFIQVGASLLYNKSFQHLSAAARHLYLCMSMTAGPHQDFKFTRTDALKCGISYSTFLRAKRELIVNNFITIKQNGKCTRSPNWYSFTFGWKTSPNHAS